MSEETETSVVYVVEMLFAPSKHGAWAQYPTLEEAKAELERVKLRHPKSASHRIVRVTTKREVLP